MNTPLRRARFSAAWIAAKKAVGAPEHLRPYDLRHHGGTLSARMPGITTKELMARLGHTSWRAALIYQHATAERDHRIASFLAEQIADAETAPATGHAWGSCGVGCQRTERPRRKKSPGQQESEAATGIEPVYRGLQALA
jgi:hypothetical protein